MTLAGIAAIIPEDLLTEKRGMLNDRGKILEYTGAKDARLKYRFFGGENAENAVIYLHGIESHGEWFCDIAASLVARGGYALYLLDRRGAGLNTESRGDCGHYQLLVDDVAKFIDLIRERHKHIHLVGHSWGGKFALYFAIRRQFMLDSLTLIAPGLEAKADLGAFTKFRIALALLTRRNPRYPTPIATEMFTRNPDALEYITRDSLRLRRATARFYFNSFLMDRYLAENADGLRLPVKIFLAGEDEVIDNAGVRATTERFHSRKMEITEYPGAAHCLLFERPEELARDLAAWLGGRRSPIKPRKILIAGSGAVGCVVGGRLAMAGHDVTLLAREKQAEPINRRGLVMGLCASKRTVKNIRAVTDVEGLDVQDVVVVCVKSFDTAAVADEIAPLCGPETTVLSLQNGVSNEDILAGTLQKSRIAGGVILGYFSVPEPGTCFHSHDRGGILLAPHTRMMPEDAQALRDVMHDTGMITRLHESVDAVKWSKLLLNVSFNALSAITDMPAEDIVAHGKLFALNHRLFRECVAVMKKLAIPVLNLPGYDARRLARAAALPTFLVRPLRKIGMSETGGRSSMWHDLRKGKGGTEIDFLNGIVVRRGRECGVPAPANAHVTKIVKQIASGEKPLETFSKNLALVYRLPGK